LSDIREPSGSACWVICSIWSTRIPLRKVDSELLRSALWFDLIWLDFLWFDFFWFDFRWFDFVWFDFLGCQFVVIFPLGCLILSVRNWLRGIGEGSAVGRLHDRHFRNQFGMLD
jgi:hypothetical protein